MVNTLIAIVKKAVALLGSLRFTVVVVCLLTCFFVLGFFIPQKTLMPQEYLQWKAVSPRLVGILEVFGFADIYSAPVTMVLFGLFFLNLAVVFWRRIPMVLQKTSLPDPANMNMTLLRQDPGTIRFKGNEKSFLKLIDLLKVKRFTVARKGFSFIAVRNRYLPVSTLFFHMSFFLLLAGALAAFYTRFSGTLILGEGELFTGQLSQYSRVKLPKWGGPPDVAFQVLAIRPESVKGRPVALLVDLLMQDGSMRVININQPLKIDFASFVIKNLGIAPLFVLLDRSGREIEGGYFKLTALLSDTDTFRLGRYQFTASFFPDYGKEQKKSEKPYVPLADPAFSLVATWEGKPVYQGTIRLGERAELGAEGVAFTAVPYWVEFYVVKEKGIMLIYAGFAIGVGALCLRFGFPRKDIRGCLDSGMIYLSGRSDFYQQQFADDLDQIVQETAQKDDRESITTYT